jgi:hypothetical protein
MQNLFWARRLISFTRFAQREGTPMKVLRLALIAAFAAASGYRAYGQYEPAASPPAAEEVGAQRGERSAEDPLQSEDPLQGSGIPSAPYPAGLSYMMTPQPFRVPYPNRIYYPPAHYVRQCPYFPKGFYWGADWNKHLLGCNPWLVHGDKRFNPYLTEAKIRHHSLDARAAGSAAHSHAPCVHCQQPSQVDENVPPEADEFEIPRAPVAAREKPVAARKKTVIPPPPRSSLTVREPLKRNADKTEPDDVADVEAEPDEFAPPPKPSVKPKNRLARQSLPAWQRSPTVRR